MPGSPRIDLGEGFVRAGELLQELRNDIDSAYGALEKDRDSQYLRRCVVRAVFSFIKAVIESVKVELRSTIRRGHFTDPLSEREKETLGSLHIVGPRQSSGRLPAGFACFQTPLMVTVRFLVPTRGHAP